MCMCGDGCDRNECACVVMGERKEGVCIYGGGCER